MPKKLSRFAVNPFKNEGYWRCHQIIISLVLFLPKSLSCVIFYSLKNAKYWIKSLTWGISASTILWWIALTSSEELYPQRDKWYPRAQYGGKTGVPIIWGKKVICVVENIIYRSNWLFDNEARNTRIYFIAFWRVYFDAF